MSEYVLRNLQWLWVRIGFFAVAVGKDEYYYFSPFIYRFYFLPPSPLPLSHIDNIDNGSIYITIQDNPLKTAYFYFRPEKVSNNIAPLFSGNVDYMPRQFLWYQYGCEQAKP